MAQPLTSDALRRPSPARSPVLLVDADAASLRVAASAVATAGGEIVASLAPEAALAPGAARGAAVAIVDVPGRDQLEIVESLVEQGLTVVATSGAGSVALAVEAMRRGAVDFVLKPFTPDGLARRLAPRLAAEPRPAAPAAAQTADFCGFFGRSAPMRALPPLFRVIGSQSRR